MHEPARDVREQPSQQEGRYGNYFRVGFNQFEFLLVFGQSYAEGQPENLHTCIVTTPSYAKTFAELLQKSVAEYEEKYGTIPAHSSNTSEGVNDHVDE